MSSIFTVVNWDSTFDYRAHDVVRKDGVFYYALTNLAQNHEFNAINFGGYFNGDTTKPLFLWKRSYNSTIISNPKVKSIRFSDGFEQRIPDGINANLLQMDVNFDNRSNAEAAAILHFLATRAGVQKFYWLAPEPYNEWKTFICEEWQHSMLYFNDNSVRAKFSERVF